MIELENISTTFDINDLFNITLSFFPINFELNGKHININGQLRKPYDIYSEIEDSIYDARTNSEEIERKDFFEIIEIMSWAIYRVWNKAISDAVEETTQIVSVEKINSQIALDLFWENLNCDEGKSLIARLNTKK
ncbi:MAG: hypothetical protein KZQ64_09385 [gamma proteobacterium symbiont of Bathyaustriella thionipta]|nr:hypothetical protein [gamma proteobacterium symbiont of Bathyaustriella thionipta]MCU7953586.1 hypothetical protein [gamma proteobacterium symbiont of Bathyaustriella thionipta]MCU7957579.1 hypothetical protein [gamma proteobacterium symbiont of Bathyaustriella thionipta]MCU7966896.1 hypothetical protein [gamma proteobacterium symbiont of Bathyaustriella thionipta]